MTLREIRRRRQELADILRGEEVVKEKSKEVRLKNLAITIGASVSARAGGYNAAESELVENIQTVLRTESMIQGCKIATRSWVVSIIAAIALWAAVLFAVGETKEEKPDRYRLYTVGNMLYIVDTETHQLWVRFGIRVIYLGTPRDPENTVVQVPHKELSLEDFLKEYPAVGDPEEPPSPRKGMFNDLIEPKKERSVK